MVEKTVATGKPSKTAAAAARNVGASPVPLNQVSSASERRISLADPEIDRLLGGGLVEGSLVLLGGEPGIAAASPWLPRA